MVSLAKIHQTLEQIGYVLVGEQDGMCHYQWQYRPEVNLFIDFQEAMTMGDLRDVLESQDLGIVDPFFATYNAL